MWPHSPAITAPITSKSSNTMPGYDSSRRSQLPRRTKLQHGLPWARSVCRVRTSHNTIILHRKYLGRSFRDPFYAFTRWASIDASKKIIRETRAASKDPNRPIIWNDQAHLTGAGVTLCLDVMHRAPGDSELTEHRALVDEAMTLLSNSKDSVLASRGHKLLSSMLKKSTAESTSKTMSDAFGCPGTTLADASKAWPIESSNSLQTVVESADEDQCIANRYRRHDPQLHPRQRRRSPNRRILDRNFQPNTSPTNSASGTLWTSMPFTTHWAHTENHHPHFRDLATTIGHRNDHRIISSDQNLVTIAVKGQRTPLHDCIHVPANANVLCRRACLKHLVTQHAASG